VNPNPTTTVLVAVGLGFTSIHTSAFGVQPLAASKKPAKAPTESITVFGASSLSASLRVVADAFEKANPSVHVTLNFAGSSKLVTQIENGAAVDVFAAADNASMDKLVKAKRVDGKAIVFARNTMVIVTPRANRQNVVSIADFADPQVVVALGAPGVPAGEYAREIFAKAGLTVKPKTLEPDVAAIVNKAAMGEIDAGIVYVTDISATDKRILGVEIPPEQNVIAEYPIATLTGASNKKRAQAFVTFTRSAKAQAILQGYGFRRVR
jgi:molybdate transport system substrate-binding protein